MIKSTLGVSETVVAKLLGITVLELRAEMCIGEEKINNDLYDQAMQLKEEGRSNIEISNIMRLNESSLRSILNKPL